MLSWLIEHPWILGIYLFTLYTSLPIVLHIYSVRAIFKNPIGVIGAGVVVFAFVFPVVNVVCTIWLYYHNYGLVSADYSYRLQGCAFHERIATSVNPKILLRFQQGKSEFRHKDSSFCCSYSNYSFETHAIWRGSKLKYWSVLYYAFAIRYNQW